MFEQFNDEQLVAQYLQGQKQAFDSLIIKYQDRITRLVKYMVRDADWTADLTQDIFFNVARGLPQFRGQSSFYTWMYRIAINTVKNHFIASQRRPYFVCLDTEMTDSVVNDPKMQDRNTPERMAMCGEMETAMCIAVDALPNDLQDALFLREFDGLTYEEIASELDCPVGTIRSRLHRARAALDQQIKPFLLH